MEAPSASSHEAVVEATRWLAAGGALAMILLAVLKRNDAAAPGGWALVVVQSIPWLAVLPGLAVQRLKAYRWTSLLVWLYVLFAIVTATSSTGAAVRWAVVELALCLLLFAVCVVHIRLRFPKREKT